MVSGRDLEEEWPDFTDSGMLERTDTLPGRKKWGWDHTIHGVTLHHQPALVSTSCMEAGGSLGNQISEGSKRSNTKVFDQILQVV